MLLSNLICRVSRPAGFRGLLSTLSTLVLTNSRLPPSPGWRKISTIRFGSFSSDQSNRRFHTSSWMRPTTKVRDGARYVTKAVLVVAGLPKGARVEIEMVARVR